MGDIHVERLWDLSQQRVDELGKELQGIADDAGVSTQTLYKWRKGQRVKGSNDRAIHRAFRWELGSREAILDGGDPTPSPPRSLTPSTPRRRQRRPMWTRRWRKRLSGSGSCH